MVAIGITALLFGAAHMDLHGLPVRTFLGVVLGYVVWRGGSIFPAMLLHGLYDMTALTYAWWKVRQLGASAISETGEAAAFNAETALMLVVGAALIGVGMWMFRVGIRRRAAEPAGFPAVPAA
jgi:membrane protease YdiL (CAAX protease family)